MYIIGYIIMAIVTSIVLNKMDWLNSSCDYDFGDYLITGMASLFWIIFMPLFLLGWIGNKIKR